MPDDGNVEQRDQAWRPATRSRPSRSASRGPPPCGPGRKRQPSASARDAKRQRQQKDRTPAEASPAECRRCWALSRAPARCRSPKSPIALPRASGGNTSNRAIIASGCRMPAAAPCSTREAISDSGFQARRAERGRGEKDRQRGDERAPLAVAFRPAMRSPASSSSSRREIRSRPIAASRGRRGTRAISAGKATLMIVAAVIVEIGAEHHRRDDPAALARRIGASPSRAACRRPTRAVGSRRRAARPSRQHRARASRSSSHALPRPMPFASASSRAEARQHGGGIGAGATRCAPRAPSPPAACPTRAPIGPRRRPACRRPRRRSTRGERVQVLAELPQQRAAGLRLRLRSDGEDAAARARRRRRATLPTAGIRRSARRRRPPARPPRRELALGQQQRRASRFPAARRAGCPRSRSARNCERLRRPRAASAARAAPRSSAAARRARAGTRRR